MQPRDHARPQAGSGGHPAGRGAVTPGRPRGDRSMAPGVALTGTGAVLLVIIAATLGAVLDILLGPALGTATTVMLAVGTAAAAWLVRRGNLLAVVIAPPLVYLLVTVATLLLTSDTGVTLTGLAAPLVYGFPAMAIATALAVLVATVRHVAGR